MHIMTYTTTRFVDVDLTRTFILVHHVHIRFHFLRLEIFFYSNIVQCSSLQNKNGIEWHTHTRTYSHIHLFWIIIFRCCVMSLVCVSHCKTKSIWNWIFFFRLVVVAHCENGRFNTCVEVKRMLLLLLLLYYSRKNNANTKNTVILLFLLFLFKKWKLNFTRRRLFLVWKRLMILTTQTFRLPISMQVCDKLS